MSLRIWTLIFVLLSVTAQIFSVRMSRSGAGPERARRQTSRLFAMIGLALLMVAIIIQFAAVHG